MKILQNLVGKISTAIKEINITVETAAHYLGRDSDDSNKTLWNSYITDFVCVEYNC